MMLLCNPRCLQVIHFPREGAKLSALKVNAINSGLSLFSPNLHGHCYASVNRQVTQCQYLLPLDYYFTAADGAGLIKGAL